MAASLSHPSYPELIPRSPRIARIARPAQDARPQRIDVARRLRSVDPVDPVVQRGETSLDDDEPEIVVELAPEAIAPPVTPIARVAPLQPAAVIAPDLVVVHRTRSTTYGAYELLRFAFAALPIIAGVDKLFGRLAHWQGYLAPQIAHALPVRPHGAMLIVGALEVLVGLVVVVAPRVGGWLLAAWLFAIVGNLALLGGAGDVMMRDVGLALGAIALARLAKLRASKKPRTLVV